MKFPWQVRVTLALACAVLMASTVPVLAQGGGQAGQGGRGGQAGQGRGGRGAAPRDVRPVPTGTGVISGRVLAADTGRPIKRARILISGGGRPFSAMTDEQGRYRVSGLPAANYNVAVTKTGYIDAAYGQRRPLRPGTPLELADGQQFPNVDFRLSRGGVITGHVVDEDGEPLAQAMVTVLRNQYVGGEKRMTPAGFDQSDDRGQFRIFGLPPGDYFVSANAGGLERIVQQFVPALGEQQPETSGYAPTYYPGTVASGEAIRLKLGASQEISGIDFQLQVVPFATVRGIVLGATSATVMLLPDGAAAGGVGGGMGGRGGGRGGIGAAALGGGGIGGLIGQAVGNALQAAGSLRAQTQQDGTFAITGVTPGKYTVIARSTDGGRGADASVAIQPLTVVGQEVSITLSPTAGVELAGTTTLEAAGTALPNGFSGFRVSAVPVGAMAGLGRNPRPAEPGTSGEFAITSVVPGAYVIRGNAPRGWAMKAVFLNGTDVTDLPIDIRSTRVDGLNVIFSDKISSLAGTVADRGKPAAGVTVIAFSADDKLWYAQSRQILTSRTDGSGAYRFGSIPPGDYLVIAVDDVEQGEWFDPAYLEQIRDAATKVKIGEGEQRTQDLKVQSS